MGEKFRDFKHLRGGEEKANPKLTAYQVELAQVEAEIEKLLDTMSFSSKYLLMSPKEVPGSAYISNIRRTWSAAAGSGTIIFVRMPSTVVGSREEGPEYLAGRKGQMRKMRLRFKSHPQPFRL